MELITGQLVGKLKAHSNVIRDIKFHPLKQQIVSCSDDNLIQVYGAKFKDAQYDSEESEESEEEKKEPIQIQAQNNNTVAQKRPYNGLKSKAMNIPSSLSFAKPVVATKSPAMVSRTTLVMEDDSSSESGEDMTSSSEIGEGSTSSSGDSSSD